MANQSSEAAARGSERALLRIPIRVEGNDTLGNAFEEDTYTQVVNQFGGLIAATHQLLPGSVIRITNLKTHICCSFQVVMRAASSLSGTAEWGVKCAEPELDIWGVHFPTRAEEPPQKSLVHALLECQGCFSREMAALTAQQYRRLVAESSLPRPCPKCKTTRDWTYGYMEEVEEVLPSLPGPSASGLAPPRGAEKRQDKRLVIKLPLGVRLPDGSEEASTTENVSKSGLCFACKLEMKVGDKVYVTVASGSPGEQCDIPARIMWRRPAKEKGRAFYGVKLETRG